jgi:hypothetical protein
MYMYKYINIHLCIYIFMYKHIYVCILIGLCAPIDDDTIKKSNNLAEIFARVSTASFNDEHVRRAITWAEALLDAHFSGK